MRSAPQAEWTLSFRCVPPLVGVVRDQTDPSIAGMTRLDVTWSSTGREMWILREGCRWTPEPEYWGDRAPAHGRDREAT